MSRFILGANPFSGFSHQGPAIDAAMKHYYTTAVIKSTIRQAESLGVNTLIARLDRHITRILIERGYPIVRTIPRRPSELNASATMDDIAFLCCNIQRAE